MQNQLAKESEFGLRSLCGARGLKIHLLPNGCIYAIEDGHILINQILASPVFGGVHRIYLRIHDQTSIEPFPIVGPGAASAVSITDDQCVWSGERLGLKFRCTCSLHPTRDAWFFHVEVENQSNASLRCDAIMLQDIGLASRAQIRNNELFSSQYLDYFVARHMDLGYVVMCRQNLLQPGETHPWLMLGCSAQASAFVTDGADFFGTAHRDNCRPAALARASIGTHLRQSEVGYTAIQSNLLELTPSASSAWSFFADFDADHPEPSSVDDLARVDALMMPRQRSGSRAGGKEEMQVAPQRSLFHCCAVYPCNELTAGEIERTFPGPLRHVEQLNGKLASFFCGEEARHVVLRAKELSTARSHGHILRAGEGLLPDAEVMSCTHQAPGVFASQLTLGNTSLARVFSGVREPLNVIRSSGLRMFVRHDASRPWQLLAVPSAFEMALNECCWHYKQGQHLLTIRCASAGTEPALVFDIRSEGRAVEVLICGELAAGAMEYDTSPRLVIDDESRRIIVRADPDSLFGKMQPQAEFHIVTSTPQAIESIGGDEPLFEDQRSRGYPYLTIRTKPTSTFSFTVLGTLDDPTRAGTLAAKYESPDAGQAQAKGASALWRNVTSDLRVRAGSSDNAAQIQDALTWFARDAVVHFSVPRGLDQPNGGAWGVRDVCQGPMEFLLSYGQLDTAAQILRRVFSQQYHRRFDWPQWFMFPPFQQIQSTHCHGDIAIWPLKALCDYLEASDDFSILHEQLPYTDEETFGPTEHREALIVHVDRLVQSLRQQFLPGLALPRYGEGDWDDSLQPADPTLRDRMVSSWTTELMYQTLTRYATAMARMGDAQRASDADSIARQIHADFQRYLMPDGIVAGFVVFAGEPLRPVEHLLHPSDTRTGLRYRLIPMTRGILSEIFSPQQAREHVNLIGEHLLFPDGARLMDLPAEYTGGRERVFRRSESAAFFGREIGLQYVHAHLRYAEAMAKLGRSNDLWRALQVVNPIVVTQRVPNSLPRQRNCYFSSSDAVFSNRYRARRDYNKLRTGEIPTDGGWRIYSSGPGIYTSLIIRHLFGLRSHFDTIEIDPVLPRELDGITCELTQNGRRVLYHFHIRQDEQASRCVRINGKTIDQTSHVPNPYRSGGVRISKSAFQGCLGEGDNRVEITL